MEFINKVIEFVLEWLGKFEGWIGLIVKILGFVKDTIPNGEVLVEMTEPLIEQEDQAISVVKSDPNASEEDVEVAKAQARENVVSALKGSLTASPRFVPEPVIRIIVEAVYYAKKTMKENGTRYDEKEVRDHAVEFLKTWGSHGK